MIKMGLRNLARRKARTALTVIGVIIGTISIVVMISIGIGMNQSYQASVMEQGSLTTISVRSYANIYDSDGKWVNGKEQKLDDSVVECIKQIKHVKNVSPILSATAMLRSGKSECYLNLRAMDISALKDFDFPELSEGTMPTESNPQTIVLGYRTINFYNPMSRTGEQVQIDLSKDKVTFELNPYKYQTSEKKKPYSFQLKDYAIISQTDNWEYDSYTYMDINYFKQIYRKYCNTLKMEDRKKAMAEIQSYEEIKLTVDNVKNVSGVLDDIEKLGYTSDSLMMFLKPMQETANMLEMVLGGIGGIAMLVSAISIANTMIMSIYERTKEIGVMKVLGCFIKDIKKLFLFESAMIGMIGGGIGVGLSYVASWAVNKYGAPLFKKIMSNNVMYDMSKAKFSIIPLWLPLAAMAFAMFIGIISGYYPARRATRISAIEAMKTEG